MEYYKNYRAREAERQSRNKRRRMRMTILPLLLVAAVLAIGIFSPAQKVLVLEALDTNVLVFSIKNGETFEIRYIHSVNKSEVVDTIARDGMKLVLRSTLFLNYGAGTPDVSEYGDSAVVTETDEGILITGLDYEYGTIELFTGTEADHRIVFKGETFRLSDYLPPQTRALISIKNMNFKELSESKQATE